MSTILNIGPNFDWKGNPGVLHDENAIIFMYGRQSLPQLDIRAKQFFSITDSQINGRVHVVAESIFAGGKLSAEGSGNFTGNLSCCLGLQAVEIFEILNRHGFVISMNMDGEKYKLVPFTEKM